MRFVDQVSHGVIGAAITVHRALGPGLLESTYKTCLADQLRREGMVVRREVILPVVYQGRKLERGYRLDMLVEDVVVVEVKSVLRLEAVFYSQLRTYLRLSEKQVGLLINFNVPVLMQGVKRMVNGY